MQVDKERTTRAHPTQNEDFQGEISPKLLNTYSNQETTSEKSSSRTASEEKENTILGHLKDALGVQRKAEKLIVKKEKIVIHTSSDVVDLTQLKENDFEKTFNPPPLLEPDTDVREEYSKPLRLDIVKIEQNREEDDSVSEEEIVAATKPPEKARQTSVPEQKIMKKVVLEKVPTISPSSVEDVTEEKFRSSKEKDSDEELKKLLCAVKNKVSSPRANEESVNQQKNVILEKKIMSVPKLNSDNSVYSKNDNNKDYKFTSYWGVQFNSSPKEDQHQWQVERKIGEEKVIGKSYDDVESAAIAADLKTLNINPSIARKLLNCPEKVLQSDESTDEQSQLTEVSKLLFQEGDEVVYTGTKEIECQCVGVKRQQQRIVYPNERFRVIVNVNGILQLKNKDGELILAKNNTKDMKLLSRPTPAEFYLDQIGECSIVNGTQQIIKNVTEKTEKTSLELTVETAKRKHDERQFANNHESPASMYNGPPSPTFTRHLRDIGVIRDPPEINLGKKNSLVNNLINMSKRSGNEKQMENEISKLSDSNPFLKTNLKRVMKALCGHLKNGNSNNAQVIESRYEGVMRSNHPKTPWEAHIFVRGEPQFVGLFRTEIEAARAVNCACREKGMPILNPKIPLPHSKESTASTKKSRKKRRKRNKKGTGSKFADVIKINSVPPRYKACTNIEGETHFLGEFLTEIEAAEAVNSYCYVMGIPPKNKSLILGNEDSKYIGVVKTDNAQCPWKAKLDIGRKSYYIGVFKTEIEAAKAVNNFCLDKEIPIQNPSVAEGPIEPPYGIKIPKRRSAFSRELDQKANEKQGKELFAILHYLNPTTIKEHYYSDKNHRWDIAALNFDITLEVKKQRGRDHRAKCRALFRELTTSCPTVKRYDYFNDKLGIWDYHRLVKEVEGCRNICPQEIVHSYLEQWVPEWSAIHKRDNEIQQKKETQRKMDDGLFTNDEALIVNPNKKKRKRNQRQNSDLYRYISRRSGESSSPVKQAIYEHIRMNSKRKRSSSNEGGSRKRTKLRRRESMYEGVYYKLETNSWVGILTYEGQNLYLGSFLCEKNAADKISHTNRLLNHYKNGKSNAPPPELSYPLAEFSNILGEWKQSTNFWSPISFITWNIHEKRWYVRANSNNQEYSGTYFKDILNAAHAADILTIKFGLGKQINLPHVKVNHGSKYIGVYKDEDEELWHSKRFWSGNIISSEVAFAEEKDAAYFSDCMMLLLGIVTPNDLMNFPFDGTHRQKMASLQSIVGHLDEREFCTSPWEGETPLPSCIPLVDKRLSRNNNKKRKIIDLVNDEVVQIGVNCNNNNNNNYVEADLNETVVDNFAAIRNKSKSKSRSPEPHRKKRKLQNGMILPTLADSSSERGETEQSETPTIQTPIPLNRGNSDLNNGKSIASWSCSEVGSFLKSINLPKYAKRFQEEFVDGEVLMSLDKEQCRALEIAVFHIPKLLRNIKRYV